jgi:predicted exporter
MQVPSFTVFSRLYSFFSRRRKLLFSATLLLIALGAVASFNIEMREDIEAMLPDDSSDVAGDFRLLQSAPFTRKIIISIKGGAGTDQQELIATADLLAGKIASPDISNIATGPADMNSGSFNSWLTHALPNLVTGQDISRLDHETGAAGVRGKLRESYERLLSPEGWALKGSIQEDPLSFSTIVMEKMRYLNIIPNMRLHNGHFMSEDGKSTMLLADTSVAMTDSLGAGRLLEHLRKQVAEVAPQGVKASIICGHRYTLANADAIKKDLFIILTLASLAVLAIYMAFLRSLSAIYVFLVPMSVLIIASGFISLTTTNVFAVTIGFGGVLLGIADEYAMHVYFSCRKGSSDLATVIGEVSRPVLFGGMATMASFAVMMGSSLPGQRQLAIYTIAGIIASLLVSLVVLPHLIKPAPGGGLPGPVKSERIITLPRAWVIGTWLLILLLSGWQSSKLRFNGDMRTVSLVPAELRADEQELARTWGDMRGKAIIFAEGKDLESALEVNDRLFNQLAGKMPAGQLVSIAPILPSSATSKENRERWKSFWQKERLVKVSATLKNEGRSLGFTDNAFAPFLGRLAGESGPISIEGIRSAGLGELVDAMILSSPGLVRIMTMVPDTPEVVASLTSELGGFKGVRLVSQSRFGDNISKAISHDFLRYIMLTSILVLLLVVAVFRKPYKILLALVPVVTGLLSMLGIMGMLGIEFNLFNIVATILIIGLCVDYGIFMVCKISEGSDHAADRAVLVSGLTTLAGFGSLVLARHPAMHSIGVTVLLGIGFGIASALLVVPALYRKETP